MAKKWTDSSTAQSGWYATDNTRQVISEIIPDEELIFTKDQRSAYKEFVQPNDTNFTNVTLEPGQYEFRVTRLSEDDPEGDTYNVSDMNVRFLEEINSSDLNYGGIAMLGFNLKASEQVSGQRPRFKSRVTRKPLDIKGTLRDCTNPAWICYDIITNKTYGMGVPESQVDFSKFEEWSKFCDSHDEKSSFNVSYNAPQEYYKGKLKLPLSTLGPVGDLSLDALDYSTSSISITLESGRTIGIAELNMIELYDLEEEPEPFYLISLGYYLDENNVASIDYSLNFFEDSYIQTPKLSFNGVIDTLQDGWSALQDVATVGRGQVVLLGNKYSVIWDAIKPVTGLYNAANSKDVSVSYIGQSEVATEIELQYSDKDLDYSMNQISIQDGDAMQSGVISNKTTVQVKGITSQEEALIHGRYLLATSKFLRRTIEFEADIEAITQSIGDVIAVQTDVTEYGIGGLIDKVIGNRIILDEPIPLDKYSQYVFKVKNHKTDEITDFTFIADVTDPALGQFDNIDSETDGLTFDDFTVNILFENDTHIYTQEIWLPDGYTLSKYDRYTIGKQNSDSLLCTIVEIDRDGELTRRIKAIEYNPSILDFNYENDLIQRIVPKTKVKNKITNFNANDRLIKLSSNETVANISFHWDSEASSKYNIYLMKNGYKEYLVKNITGNFVEFPAVNLIPEQPYTFYIEDLYDMGVYTTLEYTIEAFSSPPEAIEGFTVSPYKDRFQVDVNYVSKPLDFTKYDVYLGTQYIKSDVSDNFTIPAPLGVGSYTYSLYAIDMINKRSPEVTYKVNIEAPIILDVAFTQEKEYVKLNVNSLKTSFDITHFVVEYDNTVVNSTNDEIMILADWVGSKALKVTAYDILGNESETYQINVSIDIPMVRNLESIIDYKDVVLSWDEPLTAIPIEYYEISYDDVLIKTKTTSFRLPVSWGGLKSFSVRPVSSFSNAGSWSDVDINIVSGTVTSLQTEVIDNNVLLRWSSSNGSLPIENFILYKGPNEQSLTVVGEKKGTFTTVFESSAGQYTYWLSPVDSAGNEGSRLSATTLVSEPPDYVLNVDWYSDFSGSKTNISLQDGVMVAPLNTTETIEGHFLNNNWGTPQDQINAGYPIWSEPFESLATYEEVFDYGTTLASSLVTLTIDKISLVGTPTVSTTISISPDGVNYTDYVGQQQVYGTSFRYVKIKLDVTGSNSAVEIRGINVRLDSKVKSDSGVGTALASDTNGTPVTFNKSFVDITSIVVTPKGSTPVNAIYDFTDVPNPTGFSVYLYDNNGTRVDGDFSWSATGY